MDAERFTRIADEDGLHYRFKESLTRKQFELIGGILRNKYKFKLAPLVRQAKSSNPEVALSSFAPHGNFKELESLLQALDEDIARILDNEEVPEVNLTQHLSKSGVTLPSYLEWMSLRRG